MDLNDVDLSDRDRDLVAILANGLPLSTRPFHELGAALGLSEADVLNRLRRLVDRGVVSRFGVIVRHHELGYRANAMVVWDVPDEEVDDVGRRLREESEVTLCYRRSRRRPAWPYNLFCMVHGRDRVTVEQTIRQLKARHGLAKYPSETLFSLRRFKQRGAAYGQRRLKGGEQARAAGAP